MAINPWARYNPIYGTDAADVRVGTGAADVIYGRGGNDNLNGADGSDMLYGNDGNDILVGRLGADHNDGGAGSDTVDYQASSVGVGVYLMENRGTGGTAQGDTFVSIENVRGSAYGDWIWADDNSNNLYGNGGNDLIYGRGGNDIVSGGSGDDQLYGDAGQDVVTGGIGNDLISGGSGADVLNGDGGIDTLSYSFSPSAVKVDLRDNIVGGGDAVGDKISYFENAVGSAFNDQLRGSDGNNSLYGANGSDIIDGRGGLDVINGGTGNDFLTGGANADDFVFVLSNVSTTTGVFGPGHDRITDFQVGIDKLSLQGFNSADDISMTQVGSDTVIDFSYVDGSVTLVGVNLGQLMNSDWLV